MEDFGDAITTGEAAALLGVTRSAVARMARVGTLAPLHKMPSPGRGLYLFRRAEVERLAEIRANDGRAKPGPKPRGEEPNR